MTPHNDIKSIGFALDPNNVPAFLLDWELTKNCNLDCTYCPTGIDGGHDNSLEHPSLDQCLQGLDFMYEYVDQYMAHKKASQRKVILNVYGGESVFHPDIVEILRECHERYRFYEDKWNLTVTCTTNAVVGPRRWAEIVPLVDEFTISYHAEALEKQQQQYFDNVLYLKQHSKRFKCIIMMHNDQDLFKKSQQALEFCQKNDIRYVVKPLDNQGTEWTYTGEQFNKMRTYWMLPTTGDKEPVQAINEGRACCGGRLLSLNNDLRSRVSFVPRQGFRDWYCSVNWFFLFLRQADGAVFTNKDCRMSTTNQIEPLGFLSRSDQILDKLKQQLIGDMPIIRCKKDICRCGYCAPKAQDLEDFLDLIKRNVPETVFQSQKSKESVIIN